MKRAWIASICWLNLAILLFAIYHEIRIDKNTKALSAELASLARKTEVIGQRADDLASEASKWREREERIRTAAVAATESRQQLAIKTKILARDILDFESEARAHEPATIMASMPAGNEIMRRNNGEVYRYSVQEVKQFLNQFGGPLTGSCARSGHTISIPLGFSAMSR